MRGILLTFLAFAAIAEVGGRAEAGTVLFDFEHGPGPNFNTFDADNRFSFDLDGPAFRVWKEADPLVSAGDGIAAGIHSGFTLLGDFTVTVDFTLNDFPINPEGTAGLNEAWLSVASGSQSFGVLRFTLSGGSHAEVYSTPPNGPTGGRTSDLMSGRFRVTRVGTTMTGWIAEPGSDAFDTIGSVGGFTDSGFNVSLWAAQFSNATGFPRSATAIDVSFDDLIIEAQAIDGLVPTTVPEPSSLVSAALGLIALAGFAAHRRRRHAS